MSKSLIDYLKAVPDPRKAKGKVDELWQILLVIIMGIMSGQHSNRGLGRFAERHRQSLIKAVGFKNGRLPSYSTIRRVMLNMDFKNLNTQFNNWAQTQNLGTDTAIAGDGKSLRNTVTNSDNGEQNFIMMVSLFCQERGVVIGTAIMENKKESEIQVIQGLISQLKLENRLFTLDALHCQKKR